MKKLIVFLLSGVLLSGSIRAQDSLFSALGYFDYSFRTNAEEEPSNEFDFRRMYFTYKKKMTEKLDFTFQTDVGRLSRDGRLEIFVKNAKVDWMSPYGKIVVGLQGMNVFNIQEKTWGYRSVDKSVMDKYRFASSADLGVGYYNKIEQVNFNVLLTNGSGYTKPENDSYKKISVQANIGPGNLSSDAGYNVGSVISYEPYENGEGVTESKLVIGIFGGLSRDIFRAGVEIDMLMDTDEGGNMSAVSVYGNGIFNKEFQAFGRFDYVTSEDMDTKYFLAGIAYSPEKGFTIIPNVRLTKIDDEDLITEYKVTFEFDIKWTGRNSLE
jgi:hypothetical protein